MGVEDEVEHEAHKGPAEDDGDGALDPALLALQGSTLGVDDVMVLRLVVAFYSGRKGGGISAGAQEAVGERQSDDAGDCEEEERVEGAVLVVAVVGRHDGQTATARFREVVRMG